MVDIDIFNIQPTQLCKDLRGRFIMLYGQAKSGKTSMSTMWPKPLLCAFEKGYNALTGVRAADITSWVQFKKICRQLKDPKAHELYETIIIDTVSISYALCEKYILSQQMVSQISDIGYGKGWNMLKDEFESTFRELTQQGYALVFIAHSKTRQTEYTDEDGNAIEAYAPDLPNAAYQICNRMVDVIGYIGVEYDMKTGESHRYLYTRGTPHIFAGSRYRYLAPKIPLSYQNLVDAIADAMEKEANETGTQVVDHMEQKAITSRPFNDVMEEAKTVWKQLCEKGKAMPTEEESTNFLNRMNGIVKKVFGREMKLSQATDAQQDLVELCIDELKTLL